MRKVISSKKPLRDEVLSEPIKVEEHETGEAEKAVSVVKKAKCFFCQSKNTPTFTDVVTLRKFLTDRGKIISRQRNSLCAKHQRAVTTAVKRARHLALLPFTPKI